MVERRREVTPNDASQLAAADAIADTYQAGLDNLRKMLGGL